MKTQANNKQREVFIKVSQFMLLEQEKRSKLMQSASSPELINFLHIYAETTWKEILKKDSQIHTKLSDKKIKELEATLLESVGLGFYCYYSDKIIRNEDIPTPPSGKKWTEQILKSFNEYSNHLNKVDAMLPQYILLPIKEIVFQGINYFGEDILLLNEKTRTSLLIQPIHVAGLTYLLYRKQEEFANASNVK